MNWFRPLLIGFLATIVLSTLQGAAQGLGLTRMNIPYMLGTMFTTDRDRAKLYGFLVHLLNGFIFSLVYFAIFRLLLKPSWWLGSLIGIAHALFILIVGMWILPGLHPHMASEQHGPEAGRLLEPPGFMAINYGIQTPLAVLLSHTVYGAILGALY